MSKIDVTDEGIIKAPKKAVFNGIMSLMAGNESWWEPYLYARSVGDKKPGSVGGTAEIRIPRRARFIARIDKVEAPSRLWVSYIHGDFCGTGLWTFKSEGKATRVSFRWQVDLAR